MSSINQTNVSPAKLTVVEESGKKLPPSKHSSSGTTRNQKLESQEDSLLVNSGNQVKDQNLDGKQDIESAVAQLNEFAQNIQRDLEFYVDDQTGISVVKVVDGVSKELIRQIPNEVALDLARKLNAKEPVRLFSAQV